MNEAKERVAALENVLKINSREHHHVTREGRLSEMEVTFENEPHIREFSREGAPMSAPVKEVEEEAEVSKLNEAKERVAALENILKFNSLGHHRVTREGSLSEMEVNVTVKLEQESHIREFSREGVPMSAPVQEAEKVQEVEEEEEDLDPLAPFAWLSERAATKLKKSSALHEAAALPPETVTVPSHIIMRTRAE